MRGITVAILSGYMRALDQITLFQFVAISNLARMGGKGG
jgi:hypothetical protein